MRKRPAVEAKVSEGEVWKIRLPERTLLGRDRVVKIVRVVGEIVTMMEAPYSTLTTDRGVNSVEFLERVVG